MKNSGKIILRKFLAISLIIGFTACAGSTESDNNENLPGTVAGLHGQLEVNGTRIIDQNGDPVVLHGMSFFWSQWMGKYYNKDCIKWLRDDWSCNVIRAAMGIESDGYLENPAVEMAKIRTVIDACIDLGIYVIIDWHDHNAHLHSDAAKNFFRQIATLYGSKPNIIYEIYNEPEKISWRDDVKPYAESVIAEIRAVDCDNIIIVGSPTWSQDVDVATADPINDENVVYAMHFYAASHKQELRDKAITAMNRGYAIFVSEFGVCEYTGDGDVDYLSSGAWLNFMDQYKISWCKWSVADKDEGDAVLKDRADENGGWIEDKLTESGKFIKSEIIKRNKAEFSALK